MKDKSNKNLEDTMNDCLDRATVCPADSDEYYKLLDEAKAIASIITEQEKMKNEVEIERSKSQDWKNPVFWIPVIAPIAAQIFSLIYNRNTLRQQTIALCNLEKNNILTYSASKGLTSTVRMPSITKGA